jgi:hypothetical protein
MIKKIYKKRFLLSTVLALVFLFLPFAGSAQITNIGELTASAMASVFLLTTATISFVFSTFADWFLRITLSPEFISVPYTPGGPSGGNEFVFYGWSIVRDFVNMFFILILIIIGLSTSLQIETYRWQKTLPRLVVVALLVNFTPVILGVFIDFTNSMMNYFVASIAEESFFIARISRLYETMASNLAVAKWTSYTGEIITPVAMMVVFTIFNLFTGLVYALYGAFFALRYVAIWLLIIISPFGFFCYILPATQPFFKTWLKWFFGWCIIGITNAFFLYLGEIMFQANASNITEEAMMPSVTRYHEMDIGAFIEVFPLLIPLFFIFFGFFVSLAIASLGSKGLIETFQSASGSARKATSNLQGSNFREKTMAASAAVRNAFSPGPASSLGSSGSITDDKDKPSFRQSSREGSLHRRDISSSTSTSGIGTRMPITETASVASGGVENATKDIAAEFSQSGKQKSESSTIDTSGKQVEKNEKKCGGCGATISGNAALCPLCRRNALPQKE